MATITQTVEGIEETLTFTAKAPQKKTQLKQSTNDLYETQKLGPLLCPPDCEDCRRMKSQLQLCPPGCEECKKPCPPNCLTCKQQTSKTIPLLFNAIGIIIAVLAAYMIISTDSHIYLVFWVTYSVLRRLMSLTKTKSHLKIE